MAIHRERELVARCTEPNTEEIFTGLLRWTNTISDSEFDIHSPLVVLLGTHHWLHAGHRHGNFALFLSEALARVAPNAEDSENVPKRFPLSIGYITVARIFDEKFQFHGFRAHGFVKPSIK